jgi:hypothetical protein
MQTEEEVNVQGEEEATQDEGTHYDHFGFHVLDQLLSPAQLSDARSLVQSTIDRFRSGEPDEVKAGISVPRLLKARAGDRPVSVPRVWTKEPARIGDLLWLDPAYADLFNLPNLWHYAAYLFNSDVDDVRLHFATIDRNPPRSGLSPIRYRYSSSPFCQGLVLPLQIQLPMQGISPENVKTSIVVGSHIDHDRTGNEVSPRIPAGAGLALDSNVIWSHETNQGEQQQDVLTLYFVKGFPESFAKVWCSMRKRDFLSVEACRRDDQRGKPHRPVKPPVYHGH